MTIAISTRKNGPYVTNGLTTEFAYTFTIAEDAELKVYKLNTTTNAEETLILDTDYTVTGAGGGAGGNVVISPALGSGFQITVRGSVDQTQETDFDNQGGWHPQVHEDAFDKLTKIVIEMQEQLNRSLKVNVTDDSPDVEFSPDQGLDTFVKRMADGSFVLSEYTSGVLSGTTGAGNTASRPAGLGTEDAMRYTYFDTDLGYPVFWTGTEWSTFSGFTGV